MYIRIAYILICSLNPNLYPYTFPRRPPCQSNIDMCPESK